MGQQGVKYVPNDKDREAVKALKSFGVTQQEICNYLDINERTLTKYYGDELRKSEIAANADVARHLYMYATCQAKGASHSDYVRAQMFWLKTRARWRETDRIEHTGANGDPIETVTMSAEEYLKARRKILDAVDV